MERVIAGCKRNVTAQAAGIYVAALVTFGVFGALNTDFLGLNNLYNVAVSASINAVIGLGLTFVIITAGIDLSVGSIASLSGIVASHAMVSGGVSPVVGLVVGVVLGIACGVVNGLLVSAGRLPPFIATLGTMGIFQGVAYLVTNGLAVYNVPSSFNIMLNGYIGGFPIVVAIVLAVAILCWLLLRKTVLGQNIVAIGGSEETAWLSGIGINRVKVFVYGLAGGLAGLAGLILVAQLSTAQNEGGSPYLLTGIAAAVIGGANLMGGEGRIFGTLVGALILGALTNGLVLLNVSSFYEQIVTGLVVVLAVGFAQGRGGLRMFRRGRRTEAKRVPAPEAPQSVSHV